MLPVLLQAADSVNDTIPASAVYAAAGKGNISRSDSISVERIRASASVSDAIRTFSGIQLKDYGGVGGLKTVNVRSLGSQHTGIYIDGIQVDNAQNMQVDLGRFSTDNISSISIFKAQKTDWLQSAKEYSSANAIYLDSQEPLSGGRKSLLHSRLRGGSFGLVSGGLTWERSISSGIAFRLSGEILSSDGQYRFHVSDFRKMPDGSLAGYDTVMVRKNCDLRSYRIEGQLFGKSDDGASDWNVRIYDYDSERGLPGPVYKVAGRYPLSSDRQADNNFFIQGSWRRHFSAKAAIAVKGKYSLDRLRYMDFSELDPNVRPADYQYSNRAAYCSFSALWSPKSWWKLSLAADYQFNMLLHNKFGKDAPKRHSIYAVAATSFMFPKIKMSSSLLYTVADDIFMSNSTMRDCLTPSFTVKYQPFGSAGPDISGFVKRSFRMPAFNDLYYVTAVVKPLKPEDAWQANLGADYSFAIWRRFSLGLGADSYYNALENKIIAVPTANQFRWSMYNIGIVRIIGTELKISLDYYDGSVRAGSILRYTYQKAMDMSDSESVSYRGQIPYIPLHSGTFSAYFSYRGWRADADFFFTGERFSASSNLPQFRLKPWATGDMAFARTFSVRNSELTARFSLRNIFGSRYEIVANYPMPGISFLAGVEYEF